MIPIGGDAVNTLHKILNSYGLNRGVGATIECASTGRVLADGISDVRGVLDAGRDPQRVYRLYDFTKDPAHAAQ